MNALLNIPSHNNCKNCGECCGSIPASKSEISEIQKYLKKHTEIKARKVDALHCPFRNNEDKKCDIYAVRPIVCRLMGVSRGMSCPQGNTVEIDGRRFLSNYNINEMIMLNYVAW